jgi:hypothetical protein
MLIKLQVIAALHKESEKKDGKIREMQNALKKAEEDAQNQIEILKKEYEARMEGIKMLTRYNCQFERKRCSL